ncbi:hypothetical protein QTP86_009978 [Hemibagrus guttatus]|nr:hypothetical protein QTP86_009978 [Hemibagrus guttatus]
MSFYVQCFRSTTLQKINTYTIYTGEKGSSDTRSGCYQIDIDFDCVQVTEGVVDVIVYPSAIDSSKKRGYAFVEYESHKAAALALRILIREGAVDVIVYPSAIDRSKKCGYAFVDYEKHKAAALALRTLIRGKPDQENIDSFMEGLHLPKLSEEALKALDAEISIEEAGNAIKEFPNNKVPGPDGISIEFYKRFSKLEANVEEKNNKNNYNEITEILQQKLQIQEELCKERQKQQTRTLQEVVQNDEIKLNEICLKYKRELEEEKSTFWKTKEEILVQNHEISILKEDVQKLHDQHKDGKKLTSLSKEKQQNKEQEIHLQAEEEENNSRNQEAIHKVKEKLKVKENELCTERQRVRDIKVLVDRMKADIQTCSDFSQQPKMLKDFIKLYKCYLKRRAVPTKDLYQEMNKNYRDRTQDSRTVKINGCVRSYELEEKERYWSELDEVMESIPTGERVVIGADFNGHVGEGNTGDEEVMGKFGVKERNLEGQMVVDFAKRMDMAVVNTYFQKREEHRVTYKSGGRRAQVDYILCRRGNLKEISDCKVVVGESVARQHRMVLCRMTLMVCKKKRSEIEKKTKWWKLKKEECCEEFRQKLRQALGGQVVLPDDWETTAEVIRETGRKVLGLSSGRRKEDKETWWWNEEVQDSIQRKRLAKKKWDRTEENRQECKELQRRVKREVSKAKLKAYDELYTRLETREGEKDLYRLARQRDRDGKDVQQVRVIKDRDGRVLTSEESVQRRWKEYFEELMNEENEREKRVEGVNSVEQKVDKIRKDEVRKALKRMKSGKAVGPDDIPVEVWKCLGEAAVEFLTSLFNRILESERMPEEWRRSVLVPIFKNKGDVQSCSNYRGIKLMSRTMKLWEKVVEARLRKVVEICEQQYGFMPRKSTTDAIFALRILMEKYRDGQRELHCVFVDLEKAYDRVPREELWYCMRKSGVAEKYVRVVQDMYERNKTVVMCAVGQTEEFKVEVGLHQGSALSPFLFAIVMDQLSEEVRRESPWTMMFADDIVICSESREQVEENLERWRFALERRGMKISRSKTEYMCVNEREGSGTVRLQGEEVKKVQEFKYLGSTVQSNGECGKEVKKRVHAGWNGWRKVSGVLCDRKISARIKGKVYRTMVRPAMLHGLETVSLRKRQESELEVAELKMLSNNGMRWAACSVQIQYVHDW